jgi:outer membrane protein OmpA-like peptidoglycan-associated protein
MRVRHALIGLVACGANAATPIAVPYTAATAITISPAPERRDLVAPWSLTASDGSGLALARVEAKAVVEGPLAFTELHLHFKNTEDRVREGTFQITLPEHAAISRFAMANAGTWLEAEVVPKLVARRAYDDFLHRRQDPALLEKAAGNQFTAKVFPIAAKADKHLVISYSQELPGTRYTLPLRGLPRVAQVEIELATVGGDGKRATQRLAERDWQPDRDFVSTSLTAPAAVRAGQLVVAQVELAASVERDAPRGITLLVDTSASRALGFTHYVAAIEKLAGELRTRWRAPLEIVAFDQATELLADAGKLRDRGAAGASDLGQALDWLAKRGTQSRLVIIGDAVITAGAEGSALTAKVAALKSRVERIDVVLAGGLRDERVARQLVRAGLARAGAVLALDDDPVAVALGESVLTDVAIEVPGATWHHPRTIASARAGTRVMVFAKLPAAKLEVVAGGSRRLFAPLTGTAPLVERAVAGAELAELESRLAVTKGDDAARLRGVIAEKSVASRVLSSETALLVLESDDDYTRYGISRTALADVLVVGKTGVERMHRTSAGTLASSSAKPADAPTVSTERVSTKPPAPKPKPPRADPPDHDNDGILDVDDRCPDAESTDDDGCPVRGRVIVTEASIMVLDHVYFADGRDVIRPISYPILDAVAATLISATDIALVEVQGHTDERGDGTANLALSDRRAAAVRQYLIGKGIAPARLTAQGYGESQPLDARHTPAAWAKNRRAAFLILRRTVDDAPASKLPPPPPPVTGELAEIQTALARAHGAQDIARALSRARAWHAREPGNVLALIGLGEALEASHDPGAARVYGSIIDLFPGRADMRRFAGQRLARLETARELTIDTNRRAVADRPDHLTGHRLLAYSLVRADRFAEAFAAILAGFDQKYRDGSYAGGVRVLGEDAGMIGTIYATKQPARRAQIVKALSARKLALATRASTRFVLYWETDANDVDFHIRDARGGHAYYSKPKLASGGELYADVTTGYGPECFVIENPKAGPYQLSLDYYAQGPMGYGMGLLQIQRFDPKRGLTLEDRPYVIMTNHAKLALGSYSGK